MYLKEIESVSLVHFHAKAQRRKDAKNTYFFATYAPLRGNELFVDEIASVLFGKAVA
jgi:hypothetical protein